MDTGTSQDHSTKKLKELLSSFTQISNIVNTLEVEVTQEWLDTFWSGWKPSYSSKENYRAEALERTLIMQGLAYQEKFSNGKPIYYHDSIFPSWPWIKIDWKRDPGTGNVSVKPDVEHYPAEHMNYIGIYKSLFNNDKDFELGDILKWKCIAIVPKEVVIANWFTKPSTKKYYNLYNPQKYLLWLKSMYNHYKI
jgi:hypothetical protein